MVEKLAVNTKHNRSMKSNKKGGRGSMSNRHVKGTKAQNNFSFGGSNSLNWRNEGTKNSVSESNNYGYNNHYVANAFYSLIGLQVEIQKKDGNIHEGILETVSSKVEFHLSHACEKTNSKQDGLTKSEKMCKKLIFPFSDVVYCKALSVDIDFAKRDTLLTDSAISGTTNGSFTERELVQWQPEDNTETNITSELGEHDPNSGWAFDEMMRVNEEEHGVKSTFDSSMSSYMTPLEKGDDEEYRAREKRAEQAAREIQKEPKFKEVDNIDSSMGEEDLFSSVSRTTPLNNSNNYNTNSNTPTNNSNNNTTTNSNSNSPNNNDGFTTYTGKNYRTGRHATTPAASVVGPRLQRNNLRNHEGQNHTSTGNHQVNRNHISSPQRSQTGNSVSRNNSYQHQQTSTQVKHQQQQPPPYPRIDHHKVSVPSHQLQENIPPMSNRTQCDTGAANSTRTTLSYSAVAMKKDPISNNNRVNTVVPKPVIPLQPIVLQDVIQPVVLQQPETSTPPLPPQSHDQPSPLIPNANVSPIPSPSVPVEQVVPAEKVIQSPVAWAPEALAAAKQQMIIDARKKANMVQVEQHATTTSLLPATPTTITTTTLSSSEVTSSVITSSTITSPTRQQPQAQVNQATPRPASVQPSVTPTARPHAHNIEVTEKVSHRPSPVKVDSLEKNPANVEMKCDTAVVAASVSPKEQRSRGEEGKQPFLMKFGRIQNAAEEKKGSSYKELKDFGEQFKLEAKPKKRQPPKGTELTAKATPEVPIKAPEIPVEIISEDAEPVKDLSDAPKSDVRTAANTDDVATSSYTSPHSSPHLIITTVVATASVTVVSSFSSASTTLVTSTATTTIPSSDEPTSPSRKSSLNPAAKEFNLNPSAKEFNPVKENNAPPFTPSPKQSPARQTSSSTQVQHTPVQHQPYYHSQGAVMIHSNGPEVISPTVQSVPLKQIYARPYISPGPGGSTVYSIPAVQFANNNNNGGPQLIAAPQSGFISAQNATGQQMIIIHGPNDSYQHVVQAGQGQQYYSMQQMIRCVPGHPGSNSVQQAAARVPANFQQDGSPGGYVIAVSQHGGLVQHPSVPGNQHQGYHPPQSPVQSSHIQTQYAITHASPSTYLQNPQSPAQITYTQGNNGPAFRSPSSIHSVTGQHHPQQPFVMVTHQGQHVQTVAVPNNQTYVQGQQYGGGILQNYQSGN